MGLLSKFGPPSFHDVLGPVFRNGSTTLALTPVHYNAGSGCNGAVEPGALGIQKSPQTSFFFLLREQTAALFRAPTSLHREIIPFPFYCTTLVLVYYIAYRSEIHLFEDVYGYSGKRLVYL